MAYKLTTSVDGIERLNLPLGTHRISVEEIADLAANTLEHEVPYEKSGDLEWLEKFVNKRLTSKHAVAKAARTAVEDYGTVTPYYRIGDGAVSSDLVDFVRARVRKLWREK